MPFVRRSPLLRMAAIGGVAYMGSKAGANKAAQQQQQQQQQQEQQQQQQEPAPAAPAAPGPAGAPDRIAQLKELADLKSTGALTDAEFETEKAKILNA